MIDRRSKTTPTLEGIAYKLDRLSVEVSNLTRDTSSILNRLSHLKYGMAPTWLLRPRVEPTEPTLESVSSSVDTMLRLISDATFDMNAVRSTIKTIDEDVVSRGEFLKHRKEHD